MHLNRRRQGRVGRRLILETLESRQMLAADFELLVDATAAPERGGSNPAQLTVVGDVTFFVAMTSTTGAELWKTDGTEAGTVMVKDIRGGRVGSSPTMLTNVNGTLFFVASDGNHGAQLWTSDGTSEGTQISSSIAGATSTSYFTDMLAVGDVVYFIAPTPTGKGLWRSDGSEAGTTLIRSVGYNRFDTNSRSLIECNGNLFFIGNEGAQGAELGKSDGTTAGTGIVRDINPGGSSGLPVSPWQRFPASLANVGGVVYFAAASNWSSSDFELWKSDGTSVGTVLVKDINPGDFFASNPQHLTAYNGKLIFLANDGTNGLELWSSDGTAAGTTLLKNVAAFSSSGFPSSSILTGADSPLFTEHNGLLYFIAADASNKELWRTDGTAAGTFKVSGVLSASPHFSGFELTSIGGSLYFMDANGKAFKSDGTTVGTTQLKQFSGSPLSNTNPSFPTLGSFTRLGDQILLVGSTSETGGELWTTDGTPAGTAQLKDIVTGNGSSSPGTPVEFGGTLYFTAAGKLWTSDGSEASSIALTSPLGETLSGIGGLNALGDAMYFTATSPATGRELWRTDGTPAGTTMVKDTRPGTTSGTFNSLKRVGDKLYFNDGDLQLWESDGTELGTKPIAVAQNGSSNYLAHFNGALYFPAEVDDSGQELWRVDANGAVKLKDFTVDDRGGEPQDFVELGGLLYFTAHNGDWSKRDLWRTDGTPEGTTLAVDLNGNNQSGVSNITLYQGALYFEMLDDQFVSSLWKSDGTSAGTALVKGINSTGSGFGAGNFVEVNGILYFTADDGVNGIQVWRSDGTTEGTYRVTSATSGLAPSWPRSLTNVYGTLYFSAYDEVHGEELWKSDGTSEGTVLVKDFVPGSGGSAITWIRSHRGGVMVAAMTPEFGQEVWTMMPESEGDYTGDGMTDGADFLAWQRGFGGSVATPGDGADGNENGGVDAGDLAVWRAGFGTSSVTPSAADAAAAVASEFSVASLTASEEVSASTVGERFDDAAFGSAADAAFAWLAAERTTTDHGVWKRSPAVEVELLARDHAARSSMLAPSARNEQYSGWKSGASALRAQAAELSFGAGEAAAESQGFLAAALDEWTTREAFRAAIRR